MSITLPPLPDEFLMHPTQGECYTADQLRARDLEVARFVLEAAAKALDRLDKQARRYFAEKGSAGMPEYDAVDCAREIRNLKVNHD